jgi:hypothetical protein
MRFGWKGEGISSSSGAEAPIRAFVEASLTSLRAEFPQAYFLMCRVLAGRTVLLSIDGEEIPLAFQLRTARVAPRLPRSDVRVRTSRNAILDVLDDRLTLEGAVESGDLELRGSIEDLERFHDALLVYVGGAVRCPSFPALLDRFREAYFMTTADPTPGSSSSHE